MRELTLYSRRRGLEIIAEDAGYQLEGLRRTLRNLNIAGIRMLRFAYNEKKGKFVPRYANVKAYPANTLAYSSTHDTESLVGYLKRLSAAERRALAGRLGITYTSEVTRLAMSLITALVRSPAEYVIVPLRDWIGSAARINVPGTERPIGDRNWRYRSEVPIEDLPHLHEFFAG